LAKQTEETSKGTLPPSRSRRLTIESKTIISCNENTLER
jgi:hypothetical protein